MTEPTTLADWQDEFRGILWSSNSDTQAWFKEQFAVELELAVQSLGQAYFGFKELQPSVDRDMRSATVQMFIHVAHRIRCGIAAPSSFRISDSRWPYDAAVYRSHCDGVDVFQ